MDGTDRTQSNACALVSYAFSRVSFMFIHPYLEQAIGFNNTSLNRSRVGNLGSNTRSWPYSNFISQGAIVGLFFPVAQRCQYHISRRHIVGNNAKEKISKWWLQENKAYQIFRKTNISYRLIRIRMCKICKNTYM